VAHAGKTQNVKVGATVTLDGSGSHDEDGDAITYRWSLSRPKGSSAVLTDGDAVKPRFHADREGEYRAELVVNDGTADSTPATVVVTAAVGNSAPVADAGADQAVKTGSPVTLDGSASTDADDDLLSYQWTLAERPQGSAASLAGAMTVRPVFTPDVDGQYQLSLVVSDGEATSLADQLTVTASTPNSVPTADAGTARNVTAGDTVTLDGSGSRDADGDLITYQWRFVSKPTGSGATLSGASTVSPSFTADAQGDYVIALIVNDGQADSESVNVTVSAAEARVPPIAEISDEDYNTEVGAYIGTSGQGYDANGNAVGGYQWRFVSVPEGSQAELIVNPNFSNRVRFVPDVSGAYVIELVVGQGDLKSEPARITITALDNHINTPPVADAGQDQVVNIGEVVRFDGGNSSDADGDAVSYDWSLRSRPSGSGAELVDPALATPSLTPDQAGDYVVQLVVNDGQNDSEADTVTITAVAPLEDGLQLEAYLLDEWRPRDMPYVSNGEVSRSVTCLGSCPTAIELEAYRLTAIGGDYTLRDLRTTVLGSTGTELAPSIDGLHTGQVIPKDGVVEFTLNVERVRVTRVEVQFSFQVAETGRQFEVNRVLTLN
tara:strand:+ start:13742 stop:15559 length:1818 start_codon:yes stop_codon:yes gene_type:complete